MKIRILCYGDSNTHGLCADPNDCVSHENRFDENERWPSLLQQNLGNNYCIIEEGLSGRTTVFEDSLHEGMNGFSTLCPILLSHEPLDMLIVMLGTNDCNERTHATAMNIAQGLERIVNKAKVIDCWGKKQPKILIISPPSIKEGIYNTDFGLRMGRECVEKSAMLPTFYSEIAQQTGCYFLDASQCEYNQIDFMHLTREGHRQLLSLVEEKIREIFEE